MPWLFVCLFVFKIIRESVDPLEDINVETMTWVLCHYISFCGLTLKHKENQLYFLWSLTCWVFFLSQVQDYITAGACLALGLRFAGSANFDAFECLYEFARTFMKNMFFASTPAVVSALFEIMIALLCLFFVFNFPLFLRLPVS